MSCGLRRLGLAFGIAHAVVFLPYGILAARFGWGAAVAEMIGTFYPAPW